MKTKLNVEPFWKVLTVLALISLFISTSSTPSTYESPNAIETDARRLAMLAIAERYANYAWRAISSNVIYPYNLGFALVVELSSWG